MPATKLAQPGSGQFLAFVAPVAGGFAAVAQVGEVTGFVSLCPLNLSYQVFLV